MAQLTLQSAVKLNSGYSMPLLGFGVWASPGHLTAQSCVYALQAGYRHIDTAQMYRNESEVGDGVREFCKQSGVKRENIFVTTKMSAPEASHDETMTALKASVDKIGLDGYVDLFLIHSPRSGPEGRQALWKAMEQLHAEGKARSIGVSNYGPSHFEEMRAYAKIWPAVNQIELHPWCQQPKVVEYCEANHIAIQAYCPLVRGEKAQDPTLIRVSKKHDKSWAQVLIRWSLQKGFSPLPKSDNPARIEANKAVYGWELDEEDMKELEGMHQGASGALVRVAE
ncbi:Aldo/keto reductase [Dacryopinax primogenitus]|uniref:Aldo/keto reductase n=1 Tax=Dacryopinax primogenitus (strain DJM 731) TaxID=1858805 RepID=M5G1T4_DACPD|nr:Aldo/keto reductase [Dacryopinax primogenitus]EJT99856.1 Aldo/keto reductase [Dacryopinax primogenitus]